MSTAFIKTGLIFIVIVLIIMIFIIIKSNDEDEDIKNNKNKTILNNFVRTTEELFYLYSPLDYLNPLNPLNPLNNHIPPTRVIIRIIPVENNEPKIQENVLEKIPDAYLNSIVYLNDEQNVHDTFINEKLKKEYNESRKIVKQIDGLKEIEKYIKDTKKMENLKSLKTIDKILEEKLIIEGLPEINLLLTAWNRCYLEGNNINDIKDSVIMGLNDCVENGEVVCVDGRCDKIWGSLALIDFDKNIGNFKNKSIVRNMILEKCSFLVNDVIKNTDANIIKDYNEGTENFEVNLFKEEIKSKIKKMIDDELKDLKDWNPENINKLKAECISVFE